MISEKKFVDKLQKYYENDEQADVGREVYQDDTQWFVDLVVKKPEATFYIECENTEESIRAGMGQALGYSAGELYGIPMVVVPKGEASSADTARLRASDAVIIREFDHEEGKYIDERE
ncbi:MAG: hypothetical protein ABEK59_01210 [Halobacteria archaeon]